MSMKELKEVEWSRSYPKVIEDEKFLLIRKNWGFRLIYEAHLKNGEESIILGTCHVLRKANKEGFVVKEMNAKSPKLQKRIHEIENVIRQNIV